MRRSAVLVVAALAVGSLPLAAQLPEWITVDTAAKTVALAFDVEPGGPDGIATLNGHHHGDVQLVVPLNWTVRWTWTHRDRISSEPLSPYRRRIAREWSTSRIRRTRRRPWARRAGSCSRTQQRRPFRSRVPAGRSDTDAYTDSNSDADPDPYADSDTIKSVRLRW